MKEEITGAEEEEKNEKERREGKTEKRRTDRRKEKRKQTRRRKTMKKIRKREKERGVTRKSEINSTFWETTKEQYLTPTPQSQKNIL